MRLKEEVEYIFNLVLIFNINSFQFKKEIIEEKKVKLVNSEFPIKEEITNYLIAGKIVNLYIFI